MTSDAPESSLNQRLQAIEKLEQEIIRKAAAIFKRDANIFSSTLFIFGAAKRTLAQAQGFRELISSRNFPCAAAILRMQLDTAMRINALSLVGDPQAACEEVLAGKIFNTLKDANGIRLSDSHLRKELSKKYPWVDEVYRQTSDFVHLSGRHFYTSIASLDDSERVVRFVVSGIDPPRPDEDYYEIIDTFFNATKVAGILILAALVATSGADETS